MEAGNEDASVANSTGREKEYYSTQTHPLKVDMIYNSMDENPICYTEQKDKNSNVAEIGSTSNKMNKQGSSSARHSTSKYPTPASENINGEFINTLFSEYNNKNYSKFQNPSIEYEQTPIKKSQADLGDTRHLSSIKVDLNENYSSPGYKNSGRN